MERQLVVVLIIHVDDQQEKSIIKSLDNWKHSAEGAYAATIRVENVDTK